jgi:hypothetical protein
MSERRPRKLCTGIYYTRYYVQVDRYKVHVSSGRKLPGNHIVQVFFMRGACVH